MATKHNPIVNEDPLSREYFDDVLDLFYDANEKNEQLYNELYNTYKNNQPSGFTLGTTKSTVDLTRTLSDMRANAIQGATALLNAKKTVAEIELKKKAQSVEEDKVNNDKEYIRSIISEINNSDNKNYNRNLISSANRNVNNIVEDKKRNNEKKLLEDNINKRMESGELSLTKNEKAMKYDFNNEAEVVYDINTESLKAVKKGTNIPLKDYPIERGQVGEITRIESDEGLAYSDTGKKVKIVSVNED